MLSLPQSAMAPPEIMPVTESELRGLGHTCGGAESSEELGAGAIIGMLLGESGGSGKEYGKGAACGGR